MYSFESRIRYSQTDLEGKITPEAILDYFQDSSIFHSEDLGVGVEYLKKEGLVWVLSAWQIDIVRFPKMGERVLVKTAPYDFKGFLGFRNFVMESLEGECLACANSVWTLMDTVNKRPTKPNELMLELYKLEEKYPMEYTERKIKVPTDMVSVNKEPITVRPHHLDTNLHVNNGQYVRMAMDALDAKREIKRIRTEYKVSAVLDDVIVPQVIEKEECACILLNDVNNNPYAIVELTW